MAEYIVISVVAIFIVFVVVRESIRTRKRNISEALRADEEARLREEAAKPLFVKLKSLDSDVSFAAAQALAELGDIRAVDSLIKFAEIPHRIYSEAAVPALEKILRANIRGVNNASLGRIWKLEVKKITGGLSKISTFARKP